MMDLDELQSVQSRERQTDSLQQLRESFYRDAGEFVQQLRRERERAAEQVDDPWTSAEVGRLTDDIDTAEGTVQAIYERRVGKIVKMASLAAADMPTEDEGLTTEERALFETLVTAIEENRARVETILDGENPADTDIDATPAEKREGNAGDIEDTGENESSSVDAADLMAGDGPDPADSSSGDSRGSHDAPSERPSESSPGERPSESPPGERPSDGPSAADSPVDDSRADGPQEDDSRVDEPRGDGSRPDEPQEDGSTTADSPVDGASPDDSPPEESPADDSTGDGSAPDEDPVERTTVRITDDVGEIFGVDERAYDLSEEDVVTLPEANAGPLVERGAAERLE